MKDCNVDRRAAALEEGWLNALRQDLLSGIEATVQYEMEALRRDVAERLGDLRGDIHSLQRDAGVLVRAAEDGQGHLSEIKARTDEALIMLEELPAACCPDLSPVCKASEAIRTEFQHMRAEARRETVEAREAVLAAIERSKPDLAPVLACVRDCREVAPALAGLAASTQHVSQMVKKISDEPIKIDCPPVLDALRDIRPETAAILRSVEDSRTDLAEMMADVKVCIRDNRAEVDLQPVVDEVRSNSDYLAKLVSAGVDRAEVSPILAAIREQKPTVDLRAVLAAVRETRAVDLRPILEALERFGAPICPSPSAGCAGKERSA